VGTHINDKCKKQEDPEPETSMVVHIYNLSYSGGKGRKIKILRPYPA
jgi:hypothetical protein